MQIGATWPVVLGAVHRRLCGQSDAVKQCGCVLQTAAEAAHSAHQQRDSARESTHGARQAAITGRQRARDAGPGENRHRHSQHDDRSRRGADDTAAQEIRGGDSEEKRTVNTLYAASYIVGDTGALHV